MPWVFKKKTINLQANSNTKPWKLYFLWSSSTFMVYYFPLENLAYLIQFPGPLEFTVTNKWNFYGLTALPPGPSLKRAEIIFVVQTRGVLLLICKLIYSLQTIYSSIPGPKDATVDLKSQAEFPPQPGSLLSFQNQELRITRRPESDPASVIEGQMPVGNGHM